MTFLRVNMKFDWDTIVLVCVKGLKKIDSSLRNLPGMYPLPLELHDTAFNSQSSYVVDKTEKGKL